jgi:hypothetical protein
VQGGNLVTQNRIGLSACIYPQRRYRRALRSCFPFAVAVLNRPHLRFRNGRIAKLHGRAEVGGVDLLA